METAKQDIESVKRFFDINKEGVKSIVGRDNVQGPEGVNSIQTYKDIDLTLGIIDHLINNVHSIDPNYTINLSSLTTLYVENLFSEMREGNDMPTVLEFAYKFDENPKLKFKEGLKSDDMSQKLLHLEKGDISVTEIGDSIKSLLIDNARQCKIKKAKHDNSGNLSAPWFDTECVKAKNEINSLGNQLKKEPENCEIRSSLAVHKRIFKKIVRQKKRRYKENITDKMTTNHKNQKDFWKLLNKLSCKKLKPRHTCRITRY